MKTTRRDWANRGTTPKRPPSRGAFLVVSSQSSALAGAPNQARAGTQPRKGQEREHDRRNSGGGQNLRRAARDPGGAGGKRCTAEKTRTSATTLEDHTAYLGVTLNLTLRLESIVVGPSVAGEVGTVHDVDV